MHEGILFQSSGWSLCAVEVSNGRRLWANEREGGFSFPALADGIVVAPNSSRRDTHLYAFDALTGRERWRWTQPNDPSDESGRIGVPTVEGKSVFVGGSQGLFAVDLMTGKQQWAAGLGPILGGVAVAGNLVLAPSESSLAAVDAATGNPQWELEGRHQFVLSDGRRAYSSGQNGLAAYDLERGETIWSRKVGGSLILPAVAEGILYVYLPLTGFVALDAATGRERWKRPLKESFATPITVAGKALYAGTRDGVVMALDVTNGRELWRYRIEFEQCLAKDAPAQPGPRCIKNHPALESMLLQVSDGRLYIGGGTQVVPSYDQGLYILR